MKIVTMLLALVLLVDTSGFVRDGAVEVEFPGALRFVAYLTIPAVEVAASTLTISAEGWDGVTLEVDAEAAALDASEPEARLVYHWDIPPDDPPPLFAELDYRWSFTSDDGTNGGLEGIVEFSDPRAEWVRVVDSRGRFSVTAARSLSLDRAALRQVYERLITAAGRTPRYNLLVSSFDYDAASAVFADYQVISVAAGADAQAEVIAWLVQDAYAPHWSENPPPGWFTAGVGRFFEPSPATLLLLTAQQAARDRTLLSLDAMAAARDDAAWQAQSYSMVLYIVDQIGVEGLLELARVGDDDFADAYQRAVGEPLSALVPALSNWIFTRAAEFAYTITPYQPPTSTPPPTLTPNDTLAPTETPAAPTETPAATFTPSRTPRGLRTYVPPPTATASQTFTPLPPTVTPRPPGSLLTQTPVPGALEVTLSQPGVQVGLVTFLILVLGLLVFLLIRLGNRR